MSILLADRLRGILLGGAVGDALGAPVEFMKRSEILLNFGKRGITEFAPAYGRIGAITDDTQMTLFTLEGLMRAKVRADSRGICHPPSVIDAAYQRWLATQEGERPSEELSGWLVQQPQLWSRRAPGLTCLSALSEKGGRFGLEAKNQSKGAGCIMRVAPIGALYADAYRLGVETAALTHGHTTGIVATGWFSLFIAELCRGKPFRAAAIAAWGRCRGEAPEFDRALIAAIRLPLDYADRVPERLGEGWIAEEAAAIAIWCLLVTNDPLEALRLAVNIDGDSDTTGSLVGQALGAALGPGWIPEAWLNELELREVIETLALDAVEVFTGDSDALAGKYPPG